MSIAIMWNKKSFFFALFASKYSRVGSIASYSIEPDIENYSIIKNINHKSIEKSI